MVSLGQIRLKQTWVGPIRRQSLFPFEAKTRCAHVGPVAKVSIPHRRVEEAHELLRSEPDRGL